MTTSLDHAEAVARATELSKLLASEAPEGERTRRVTATVIDAVTEADLLRLAVPTSLGGHGLGLGTLTDVTRVLAHGCPASAWTLSFLMQHAWLVARFPEAGRAELFAGGPTPTVSAPLAPTGTATPVDGGFVVSGTWEWATAVEHAEWAMVHAIEPGTFSTHFLVMPRTEVEVDDVWFTSGMRATGSNTVRVTDVFAPAHRSLPGRSLLDNSVTVDGDGLAGIPLASVLCLSASAPALGAAEAAVELYRERLANRVLVYSLGDRAAEQPAAQVRLAAAVSDVTTARAAWDAAIATMSGVARSGAPTPRQRVDARLAAAATVRAARRVIGDVAEGAGASVYRSEHPLQRLQRDVETLKGHVVFDWDRTAELAGRVMLGLDLRPADMV